MTDTVKVKAAIAITLIIQTAALAYFFGTFQGSVERDVEHLERDVGRIEGRLIGIEKYLMGNGPLERE